MGIEGNSRNVHSDFGTSSWSGVVARSLPNSNGSLFFSGLEMFDLIWALTICYWYKLCSVTPDDHLHVISLQGYFFVFRSEEKRLCTTKKGNEVYTSAHLILYNLLILFSKGLR